MSVHSNQDEMDRLVYDSRLRDEFAAIALASIIETHNFKSHEIGDICYDVANSMMKAKYRKTEDDES